MSTAGLTSEFAIIAIVRDKHAGERTFSADELRETLTNALADLGLEVVGELEVNTPNSYAGAQK